MSEPDLVGALRAAVEAAKARREAVQAAASSEPVVVPLVNRQLICLWCSRYRLRLADFEVDGTSACTGHKATAIEWAREKRAKS